MPVFRSTRGQAPPVSFSDAIRQGLAPDGGLYLPDEWPAVRTEPGPLPDVAARILMAFAGDDPLAPALDGIAHAALDFPMPLVPVDAGNGLYALELFHGPTAAFKDVGARVLARCLAQLPRREGEVIDILVATSGDTGGAVAAACLGVAGLRVTLLFPKGLVSPTQERQLTCWGGNVRSLAVRGTFDDCQRMVKEAFMSPVLRARHTLASANSINIGRLLPQAAYYAWASAEFQARHGRRLSFIVPSGNLGNAFAAVIARRLGFPVGRLVVAHNTNDTVPRYLATGAWSPRPSVPTLASAMDVGNPSNMERFQALFPTVDAMRAEVSAVTVSDEAIRARITADATAFGRVWCPHSAVGAEAWACLDPVEREGPWCVVATAHPAKFRETVEPLIGRPVALPEALAALFARPTHADEIDATLDALPL